MSLGHWLFWRIANVEIPVDDARFLPAKEFRSFKAVRTNEWAALQDGSFALVIKREGAGATIGQTDSHDRLLGRNLVQQSRNRKQFWQAILLFVGTAIVLSLPSLCSDGAPLFWLGKHWIIGIFWFCATLAFFKTACQTLLMNLGSSAITRQMARVLAANPEQKDTPIPPYGTPAAPAADGENLR